MIDHKIAADIKKLIDENKRFLLHFHRNPDPDSVGSALAMGLFLQAIGKQVTVISGDSVVPDFLEYLPGKELVVTKNWFEIDQSDFDVFLILDSGALDRVSNLEPVVFSESLRTVVIDHHISNVGFAEINLIDQDYAATAEMLFDIFTEWRAEITPAMAHNLFMGLYTDTGGFRYRATTSHTLTVAAALAKIAPDFSKTLFNLMNNRDPETLVFERLMIGSIEKYCADQVVIASLDYQTLKENNLHEDHMHESIANKLIAFKGWNIGVSMIELAPGQVKVSLRTRDQDKFNLSTLATALGGGGHVGAAGVTLSGTIAEAKAQLLKAVADCYAI